MFPPGRRWCHWWRPCARHGRCQGLQADLNGFTEASEAPAPAASAPSRHRQMDEPARYGIAALLDHLPRDEECVIADKGSRMVRDRGGKVPLLKGGQHRGQRQGRPEASRTSRKNRATSSLDGGVVRGFAVVQVQRNPFELDRRSSACDAKAENGVRSMALDQSTNTHGGGGVLGRKHIRDQLDFRPTAAGESPYDVLGWVTLQAGERLEAGEKNA